MDRELYYIKEIEETNDIAALEEIIKKIDKDVFKSISLCSVFTWLCTSNIVSAMQTKSAFLSLLGGVMFCCGSNYYHNWKGGQRQLKEAYNKILKLKMD